MGLDHARTVPPAATPPGGKHLYVSHLLVMREAPAWRCLPDNARRVLDRLEVEHLRRRGRQNGQLLCPYGDFQEWGLRRASVRLAIEQAAALGFLEVTRRGFKAVPSLYRLTYVRSLNDKPPPTDEWRAFHTIADAKRALTRVEAELDKERELRKARKAISPRA